MSTGTGDPADIRGLEKRRVPHPIQPCPPSPKALIRLGMRPVSYQEDKVRCKKAHLLTLRRVRQPVRLHAVHQKAAERGPGAMEVYVPAFGT